MARIYHKHQCTIKDGIYWHKLKINHKSEFGKNEHKKEISSYKQDMKEYRTARDEIKKKGGKIRKYRNKIIISGGLLSLVSLLAILNAIPGVTSSGLNDFYCDEVCEIPFTVCTSKYDLDLRGRQIQPFYFDKNVTLEKIINNENGKHFTFNNNILRKGKCWNLTAIVKKEEFETIKYGFKIGDMDIDPLLFPSEEYKAELNYTVLDIDKNIKKINVKISDKTLNDVENKIYQGDLISLKKTNYFGDGVIKLKEKINVTKERVKRSYDCNCTNETFWNINNKTEENTSEVREVCNTCYEYENYTEEVMREINPETFVLNKNVEIFEVFESEKRIDREKWGISIWTDISILGQNIEGASWFNSSWTYMREINLSNTAGNLTDYQVKIILNTTNFNYSHANTTGKDLRFTNSSDDLIDYWIEDWNTSGSSYIWVEVPTLANATNTTIYMYYGNSDVSSASSKTGVFGVNLTHFYPFSGDAKDKIGIINGTVSAPTLTTDRDGVSNSAYDFNGANDQITYTSDWIPQGSVTDLTVCLWIESDNNASWGGLVRQVEINSAGRFFWAQSSTGQIRFSYFKTGGTNIYSEHSSSFVKNDVWQFICVGLDASEDKIYWYYDGTFKNKSAVYGGYNQIGGRNFGCYISSWFDGKMDEIRFYDKLLSTSEIERFYASPEPTLSIGSEETQEETTFSITLNSPANETVTSDSTPDFNFTVIGSESSYECELFINGSGYGKAESWCYQESANVSTACGGLNSGKYNYDVLGQYQYFYVNYTKPFIAINTSLWKVRHGILSIYNITLTADCWNSNILRLGIKIFPSGGGAARSSQPICWNGTEWKNIGTLSFDSAHSTNSGSDAWNKVWDGNWSTFAVAHSGLWINGTKNNHKRIYEEAMWWNMNLNNTATIITANQSLLDGNYNWYINCTADGVTNQSEIRQITIDTNISIETGIFDIIKTGTTLGGKALIRVKNTI